jgi:hypothetical protein
MMPAVMAYYPEKAIATAKLFKHWKLQFPMLLATPVGLRLKVALSVDDETARMVIHS